MADKELQVGESKPIEFEFDVDVSGGSLFEVKWQLDESGTSTTKTAAAHATNVKRITYTILTADDISTTEGVYFTHGEATLANGNVLITPRQTVVTKAKFAT